MRQLEQGCSYDVARIDHCTDDDDSRQQTRGRGKEFALVVNEMEYEREGKQRYDETTGRRALASSCSVRVRIELSDWELKIAPKKSVKISAHKATMPANAVRRRKSSASPAAPNGTISRCNGVISVLSANIALQHALEVDDLHQSDQESHPDQHQALYR